uniref:Uncharacterized protein n=1 Tax=Anopheles arabiensis TaxID=7173 RepID=A0A182HJ19_ANOAR
MAKSVLVLMATGVLLVPVLCYFAALATPGRPYGGAGAPVYHLSCACYLPTTGCGAESNSTGNHSPPGRTNFGWLMSENLTVGVE